jgi:hypothetical protein
VSALTLEELLKPDLPLKAHPVPLPERGNGSTAFVAELSMDEREERVTKGWQSYLASTKKTDGIGETSWIAAACLCDSDRNFLCSDAMAIARAAQQLGQRGTVTFRLYSKAMQINSLSQAEVEELEKN